MSDQGPGTPPGTITIDSLVAEVQALGAKHDALLSAHANTVASQQAVIVAQASQQQAATAEATASQVVDDAFAQLTADLQAFKAS